MIKVLDAGRRERATENCHTFLPFCFPDDGQTLYVIEVLDVELQSLTKH